jgi:hypothetical protein
MADKPVLPNIPKKTGPTKTYIWLPDSKGALQKVESSVAKKAFANLPAGSQVALAEYLISTNVKPTDAARKTLWNTLVDGAVDLYKKGKKETPWDSLAVLVKNAPDLDAESVSYTEYDGITADALLSTIAKNLGFDTSLITASERTDFLNKLNEQAKASGREVRRKVTGGGTETVTTPSLFNAKDFTESWLWAKVNLDDVKTIPAKAIAQISSVKDVLRAYNVTKFSTKEINDFGIKLASGALTADSLAATLSAEAAKNYPLYADRFAANPKLTVRDIAEPAINIIAKYWEMDPNSINLDDDILDNFLRPDGTVGKATPMSLADLTYAVKNHPNAEKTTWANEAARDGAVGIARAMGFGI